MKTAPFKHTGLMAMRAESWGQDFPCGTTEPPAPFTESGAAAIVEINGPLTRAPSLLWDSYDAIRTRVAAALMSPKRIVVLRIDSPGGEAGGCFELSDRIRAMAAEAGKSLIAYVEGCALSAAYAIACGASHVFVTRSAEVGSVGVYKMLVDQSAADTAAGLSYSVIANGARKLDGNPHVPTSEETRMAAQKSVDELASLFFDLVGRARAMTSEGVASLEGATFIGASAVSVGLADAVVTSEELQDAIDRGADFGSLGMKRSESRERLAAAPDAKRSPQERPSEAKGLSVVEVDSYVDAKFAAMAEASERSSLLASRPDFSKEIRATLAKAPISVVRDAVTSWPASRMRPPSQILAARAAMFATPTFGAGQDGRYADALPEGEASALDVAMGIAPRRVEHAIRLEGTKMIMGVITPAEARALAQRKEE